MAAKLFNSQANMCQRNNCSTDSGLLEAVAATYLTSDPQRRARVSARQGKLGARHSSGTRRYNGWELLTPNSVTGKDRNPQVPPSIKARMSDPNWLNGSRYCAM